MLTIRYLRVGRRNSAFFRIVLTEKSKPAKSGFIKILGWYNPHTKETSLNKEEILGFVNNGAIPSNSVAKLLIANKITHKNIKFVKDAPGKSKQKEEEKKPAKAETEVTDATPETPEAEEAVTKDQPETEKIAEPETEPEAKTKPAAEEQIAETPEPEAPIKTVEPEAKEAPAEVEAPKDKKE
jgi:small subunit ribosomal protein S16